MKTKTDLPHIKTQPQIELSIIIACFNAESYIERCIKSAIQIKKIIFEIIIVDDNSTDHTIEKIQSIFLDDERICIKSLKQNVGPGVARNHGINSALGRYIAIVDADDEIIADSYEKCLMSAIKNEQKLIALNVINCIQENEQIMHNWISLSRQKLLFKSQEISMSKFVNKDLGLLKPIINREFLIDKKISYLPYYAGEDFAFWFECLVYTNLHYYHLVGYKYQISKSSLSSSAQRRKIEFDVLDILKYKYKDSKFEIQELSKITTARLFADSMRSKDLFSITKMIYSNPIILFNTLRLIYQLVLKIHRIFYSYSKGIPFVR